ncbi:hypothetical protein SMB58_004091 [Cronobacter sakazakii]|nr:hypothetical protein [Cronobacter sakazakii]ELY3705175.1 hypothetical protein [Cronobacter sakazakii]
MNIVTLADISTPLKNYGYHLDNVTTAFHESLFSYLEVRDFFHIAITGKIEQGSFCATMPKLQFSFASRNKFIIYDKNLISVVEFFALVNKEEISILKCYLRFDGDLTFESPTSDVVFNTADSNLQSEVFNRILSSAYEKELISA